MLAQALKQSMPNRCKRHVSECIGKHPNSRLGMMPNHHTGVQCGKAPGKGTIQKMISRAGREAGRGLKVRGYIGKRPVYDPQDRAFTGDDLRQIRSVRSSPHAAFPGFRERHGQGKVKKTSRPKSRSLVIKELH